MNVILLIINFLFFNLNTQAYELQVINYGIYDSNGEHLKKQTVLKVVLIIKNLDFVFNLRLKKLSIKLQ